MSILSTVPKGAAVEGINPNLLRNWYFVGGGTGRGIFPVNSRGQSGYSNISNAYTIDGWGFSYQSPGGNIIFNSNYISLSGGGLFFRQRFNAIPVNKTYTFTMLLSDGTIQSITGACPSSESDYVTVSGNPLSFNSLYARIYIASGVTYNVVAIKLELGTEQTLAHQENGVWILNEIPDYEYELYRCKTSTADPSDIYENKVLSTNIPNKNLLDNWYFGNPVNQRGITSFEGGGANYFLDRWRKINSLAGTSDGGFLHITDANWGIRQIKTFPAGTYTFSMLAKNFVFPSGGTFGFNHYDDAASVGSQLTGTDWGLYTITVTATSSFPSAAMQFNSNLGIYSIDILAVKLELGTEQTLAHQENGAWVLNEIPDYGEELRKCQRYLFVIDQFVSLPLAGIGVARNSTTAILQFPTPVTMNNTTPTVTFSGTLKLWHGSVTRYEDALQVTSLSGAGLQSTAINFGVNVAGGLTSGEICMFQMSEGSKIIISCEP